MKKFLIIFLIVCGLALIGLGCVKLNIKPENSENIEKTDDTPDKEQSDNLSDSDASDGDEDENYENLDILRMVPVDSQSPYAEINDNMPFFTTEERKCITSFEKYSDLDDLGRCGVAYANICIEMMPTEPRGTIGQVRPSGWQIVKYDFVDGKYLYNRCHLIGYQLAGENANEKNLITGTRYLNVEGMLPFENMVYEYVIRTENHVLYRVTPLYKEDEPVARGVLMEAYSVEDAGEGICFNVFVYNKQPGVVIDYATGDSRLEEEDPVRGPMTDIADVPTGEQEYVLNLNSMVFHYPACDSVLEMKEKNKKEVVADRAEIIEQGYRPCHRCSP